MTTRGRALLARLAVIVGLGLLWEGLAGGVIASVQILNPSSVGRPSLILSELYALVASGKIWPHALTTLSEVGLGLALGVVGGLAFGVLAAYERRLDQALTPIMNGLNALPHLALAPFIVSWIGIGLASKVLLSALMALFPIFYNVYQGVRDVRPDWMNALRVMGASRAQIFRIVVVPSLSAWLLSGLRVSAGLALVGAVVGEFIGASQGLGYLMMFAQGFLKINQAMAILLVLGVWGVAMDVGLRRLDRALRPGAPTAAEGSTRP